MKKIVWFVIIIAWVSFLTSCAKEKENVSFTRNFTLEVTYENGDIDTMSYEYTRIVTKETLESKGEDRIISYELYDGDSSPCIIVRRSGYSWDIILCSVRKFQVLSDEKIIKDIPKE